jgi:hypothetical protein
LLPDSTCAGRLNKEECAVSDPRPERRLVPSACNCVVCALEKPLHSGWVDRVHRLISGIRVGLLGFVDEWVDAEELSRLGVVVAPYL